MELKHTPGPWRPVQIDGAWVIRDVTGQTIATLEKLDNAGANAVLISASPRLLETLTGLSACHISNEPEPDMDWESAERTIRQAIGQIGIP